MQLMSGGYKMAKKLVSMELGQFRFVEIEEELDGRITLFLCNEGGQLWNTMSREEASKLGQALVAYSRGERFGEAT
jgi:hypothetical protein